MAQIKKKDLIARKNAVVHDIVNIKQDYQDVLPEDLPQEIVDELAALYRELMDLREALGKE